MDPTPKKYEWEGQHSLTNHFDQLVPPTTRSTPTFIRPDSFAAGKNTQHYMLSLVAPLPLFDIGNIFKRQNWSSRVLKRLLASVGQLQGFPSISFLQMQCSRQRGEDILMQLNKQNDASLRTVNVLFSPTDMVGSMCTYFCAVSLILSLDTFWCVK